MDPNDYLIWLVLGIAIGGLSGYYLRGWLDASARRKRRRRESEGK